MKMRGNAQKISNKTINIRGYLLDFECPKVMGILNVTPDSFFSKSRTMEKNEIRERAEKMLSSGVDIIDIGGCSTRPGFEEPTLEEEWDRVNIGCEIIRELDCKVPLSIDTYRSQIARKAIETYRADIINDISGGIDNEMWDLVAEKKIVYVLTHNQEIKATSSSEVTATLITDIAIKLHELYGKGINDVIIDPGFGFSKTKEQNFAIFRNLEELSRIGNPVMVGVSRKSMIYKTLGTTPEDSLTGTISLNSMALDRGANILRVHDMKEAKDTIKLYNEIIGS